MKVADLEAILARFKKSPSVPKNLTIMNEELEEIQDIYLAFDGIKYLGIVLSPSIQKAMPPSKKRGK
jgi:hypothetical protein